MGWPFIMYLLSLILCNCRIFLSIALFVRKHGSVPTKKSTRVSIDIIWWIHYSCERYVTAQCAQNRHSTVLQGWEFALLLFALSLKITLFKERSWAIRCCCSLKKSDHEQMLMSLFTKEWREWIALTALKKERIDWYALSLSKNEEEKNNS